ncbi:hypothetical protein [Thermobifida halotolerans]|uniref:hypothetical protein n=1 Tax=Thermobifida halotolerans TaxID=483545 RepID=UPI003516F2E8
MDQSTQQHQEQQDQNGEDLLQGLQVGDVLHPEQQGQAEEEVDAQAQRCHHPLVEPVEADPVARAVRAQPPQQAVDQVVQPRVASASQSDDTVQPLSARFAEPAQNRPRRLRGTPVRADRRVSSVIASSLGSLPQGFGDVQGVQIVGGRSGVLLLPFPVLFPLPSPPAVLAEHLEQGEQGLGAGKLQRPGRTSVRVVNLPAAVLPQPVDQLRHVVLGPPHCGVGGGGRVRFRAPLPGLAAGEHRDRLVSAALHQHRGDGLGVRLRRRPQFDHRKRTLLPDRFAGRQVFPGAAAPDQSAGPCPVAEQSAAVERSAEVVVEVEKLGSVSLVSHGSVRPGLVRGHEYVPFLGRAFRKSQFFSHGAFHTRPVTELQLYVFSQNVRTVTAAEGSLPVRPLACAETVRPSRLAG